MLKNEWQVSKFPTHCVWTEIMIEHVYQKEGHLKTVASFLKDANTWDNNSCQGSVCMCPHPESSGSSSSVLEDKMIGRCYYAASSKCWLRDMFRCYITFLGFFSKVFPLFGTGKSIPSILIFMIQNKGKAVGRWASYECFCHTSHEAAAYLMGGKIPNKTTNHT